MPIILKEEILTSVIRNSFLNGCFENELEHLKKGCLNFWLSPSVLENEKLDTS